jgi:hypothetical protein
MSRFLVFIGLFVAFAAAQEREPSKGINFYSIEQEMALGRRLAAEFQRDTKPLGSPAALAYINGIGQRLAAQIGAPPFTYQFAVVADDPTVLHEVAAFPGGFLFVPASLILAVKDEDDLAGMLARAIAHVASRDGTRQATKADLINASVPLFCWVAGRATRCVRANPWPSRWAFYKCGAGWSSTRTAWLRAKCLPRGTIPERWRATSMASRYLMTSIRRRSFLHCPGARRG